MARKTKTLKIEGLKEDVVIQELTVRQIVDLVDNDNLFAMTKGDKGLVGNLKEAIDSHFLELCTNIKTKDFLDMAPSDVKEIWDAFKEVNSVFFDMARQAGLMEVVNKIKDDVVATIKEDFSKLPVGLLKQATSESLTTDTPT